MTYDDIEVETTVESEGEVRRRWDELYRTEYHGDGSFTVYDRQSGAAVAGGWSGRWSLTDARWIFDEGDDGQAG